jgi:hypothetical protein
MTMHANACRWRPPGGSAVDLLHCCMMFCFNFVVKRKIPREEAFACSARRHAGGVEWYLGVAKINHHTYPRAPTKCIV